MQNDQIEILKELLELSIKAGRRMMHDFDHMLNEVPDDNDYKKEYRERGKHWQTIFYPDDGMKNYRARLHYTIAELDRTVVKLKQQIINLSQIPDDGLPF